MEKIIVFDVETPNRRNDRICSMGISIIENETVSESKNILVNPECFFDDVNISIHGILPEDVEIAPTFPAVWKEIKELFENNILAAHNAHFDISVLRKTLEAYGLEAKPFRYLCSMQIAKKELPQLCNYKLPTLCDYFDIDLQHHNSGSDSFACAEILCRFMQNGISLQHCIEETQKTHNEKRSFHSKIAANTQAILTLKGIVSGIVCDEVLSAEEVRYLRKWLSENGELKGNYPYDILVSTIEDALKDGILEKSELDAMLHIFEKVFDPLQNDACICKSFDVADKTFCLTGEFAYGERTDVERLLQNRGGIPSKTVTQKTDILIVGGHGSALWSAGNYGSKVKKAIELQEKGFGIQIIHEQDIL